MTRTTQTDLAALVRLHQGGVWRYLRWLGCQPAEADDLTQESFLVILARGFAARSDEQTAGFLRQTARHLFLQRCRARSRSRLRLRADMVDAVCARSVDPVGDGRVAMLRECLGQLDGRPRAAVRLFYREGKSRAEVAVELGMQETGVKTLLQRTRAALRKCMERMLS